jgi:two-component system, OmpR family, sensor histidine kinase VicK
VSQVIFGRLAAVLWSMDLSWLYNVPLGVFATFALLLVRRSVKITHEQSEIMTLQSQELEMQRMAIELHAMVNISDANGNIVYVNQRFIDSVGYQREELIGRKLADFLAPEMRAKISTLRSFLQSGQPWTGETKITRKDGTFLWTRSTIVPSLDAKGQIIRTISLRTDITASKIQQAEIQTRMMMDGMSDQVYQFEPDTLALRYVNKRGLQFQGWQEHEAAGKRLHDTTSDFDESKFRERVAPLLSGEIASLSYESMLNGVPVDICLQMEMCFDRKSRFIAVVRDITRRRELEEAKAQFVSTVSHELRSPLTSIMGSLKLLSSGALGELPKKHTALLSVAMRNVDRLILLINDLLDMEKLDAGKMDIQIAPVDLSALLEDAVKANSGLGDELKVTFRTICTDRPLVVGASRDRLMQVLTNLMSNAAKFSRPGSVVDLELSETDDMATIAVRDKGVGIPKEAQVTLFERFVQVDSSQHGRQRGTGLGLSICKSIVEKHGGTIRLFSEVGSGTTFCVDLPKDRPIMIAA